MNEPNEQRLRLAQKHNLCGGCGGCLDCLLIERRMANVPAQFVEEMADNLKRNVAEDKRRRSAKADHINGRCCE